MREHSEYRIFSTEIPRAELHALEEIVEPIATLGEEVAGLLGDLAATVRLAEGTDPDHQRDWRTLLANLSRLDDVLSQLRESLRHFRPPVALKPYLPRSSQGQL